MRELQFSKMQSLGNDFMVIDGINQSVKLNRLLIQRMADRHCGIGFDQLLLIESSDVAVVNCRIFNADGSEAEQCGNGMRCVARFLYEKKLHPNKQLTIETKAGIIQANIHTFREIEVNMGSPSLIPEKIPFKADQMQTLYTIPIDANTSIQASVISMGNPHAIIKVEDITHYPIAKLGSILGNHALFPHGVNVGIVQVIDHNLMQLRTFERGAGETLACGSNACAAAVAGIINGWINHSVVIQLPLGQLLLSWEGDNHPVIMRGPAEQVFDGTIAV